MSIRIGTPKYFVSSGTLGGASGRNITYPDSLTGFSIITSIGILYTATATAGSRQPILLIKDQSGNAIWEIVYSTAITASQVVHLHAAAGATFQSVTGPPLAQYAPIPIEMPLPAFFTVSILDNNNVDPNDSVAAATTYTL